MHLTRFTWHWRLLEWYIHLAGLQPVTKLAHPDLRAELIRPAPALHRSMVAALVVGAMGGVKMHDSWPRHAAVVDAACLALTSVGPAGATAAA